MVILYEFSPPSEEATLLKRVLAIQPPVASLSSWPRYARDILHAAGSCGSDLVWRYACADEIAQDSLGQSHLAARPIDDELFRQIVRDWHYTSPNLDALSSEKNVSDKFAKLVQILRAFEAQGTQFRVIVFVQHRITAAVLVDLIRMVKDLSTFIRPQALISHDQEEQQNIMRDFAEGRYNLLLATKSMEDLDIPKVDVVIRFDLFESQVSYAYSRACLRGPDPHLIHLVENGNDVHRRILSDVSPSTIAVKTWMFRMSSQEGAIPPSTIHESTDPYRSDDEDAGCMGPCITDPCTSGRIYHRDATAVLLRFLARSGSSHEENSTIFHYRRMDGSESNKAEYVCSIRLPGVKSHVVTGDPCDSIAHARRLACYNACRELGELGSLDYRILPRPTHVVRIDDPEHQRLMNHQQNAHNGTRKYPRKCPDFWLNSRSVGWDHVYPTVISVRGDEASSHGPIVMLTRLPLPSLSSTKLFYIGVPIAVQFSRAAQLTLDGEKLRQAHAYTMRVCKGIMNRAMDYPLQNMPYLLLPLDRKWLEAHSSPADSIVLPSVEDDIPWNQVELAVEKAVIPLRYGSVQEVEQDVEDAVIQDRWVEFTRRYEVNTVRGDLSPLSAPTDSPREAGYPTFVAYCEARRKGFDRLKSHEQPLIEIKRLSPLLNRLNPSTRPWTESTKATAKYLIPELCVKHTIPASTFRTALLLPSITRRINDMLLVKELNAKLFDHCLREDLLHTAITAPSAGFEFDYERLELLGDAYLKYLSSVYLFVTNPQKHEGALHHARQRIISNKSLLEYADSAGLPPFIQSKPFVAKLWQPLDGAIHSDNTRPGPSTVEQQGAANPPSAADRPISPAEPETVPAKSKRSKRKRQLDEQGIQWLGDKAVADVAEAIIGAGYMTGGREVALKVTKALNIPVPRIDRWEDFGRKPLAVAPETVSKLKPGRIDAVERIIGHKFQRPQFLAQALTHTSVQGYDMTSYERLEFLGDAILDFMVIRHLYFRETQLSPGGLTLLKGAMVSNSALAALCVWSGLHRHLLFESKELASSIQTYEAQLKVRQDTEYAEADLEGRSPGQYWLDIEPPKALSDVVESIIGAIYISDNFSPVGSEAFFVKVLRPFYDKHITLKTLSHHPTKTLFELFQAEGCHEFEMVKQQMTRCEGWCLTDADMTLHSNFRLSVVVHDTILAAAASTSSFSASRRASFCALDALEGDPDFMRRTCNCRLQSQVRHAVKKALKDIWRDEGDDEVVEAVLAG
ncbi:ribonuclease III [Heliocybe sulcata]|uniref:Ribonuclease III n=1 Tax=Heliocybe sulcata TaxID=5364 RepID=A0A5C3NEF0_9AGAM|nr:ribonuclease III [Heliocybe sulcata]